MLTLPRPAVTGAMSLEETIARRRSIRSFRPDPVDAAVLSQILWAAQGITGPEGERAAPSAGATYALETVLFTGPVAGVGPGVWRYRPRPHALKRVADEDRRPALAAATGGQPYASEAPAAILFAGVHARCARKYGSRAERYVAMEAGHAGQNVSLQAVGLGLGTVMIGAFDDAAIRRLAGLARDERPLYLIPVGRP